MARIASSLKPTEAENEKQKPKLDYNDKTYQSYIENGFENALQDNEKVNRVHDFKEDFLQRAAPPIKFHVNSFMRLMAVDYDTPNQARKEFMTYSVDWLAKDFMGDDITEQQVLEHIEGVYQEQLKKKVTNQGRITGYERTGERTRYYIPWNRKAMDKLIDESVGSDKDTIRYTVKFQSNRTQFTYEQFATLSYQELDELQQKHKEPRSVRNTPA
jgi:uncharacterized membrane-anchored protein YjiN (DUF445 family)